MFTPMHAEIIDGTPPAPEVDDQPAPLHARSGGSEVARTARTIPTARVNLMPAEVLIGRQVRRVKRRTVLAVAVILVGALGGLGWFKFDASRASAGLGAEQAAVEALKLEQQAYSELLRIDIVARDIDRSLASVMGDDVAWDQYLAALTASAPAGVQVTGVTVLVSDVTDGKVGGALAPSGSLDSSGQEHIGALTVTGLAPTHEVVAAWADSLTDVTGFLVPYILGSTVVIDGGSAIQFSIELTLSSAIRNLRYAAPAPGTATDGQGG